MTIEEMNAKYGLPMGASSQSTNPFGFKQATPITPTEDPALTAGKSLVSSFKERGQKAIDIAQSTAADIQKGQQDGGIKGFGKVLRGVGEAGLQQVGNVAGAVGDIFGAGIKLFPGAEEKIQKVGEGFLKGKNILGETNEETIKKLSNFAEQNPHLAKDAASVFNILTLGLGKEIEQPIKSAISKIPQATEDLFSGIKSVKNPIAGVVKKVIPDAENLMNKVAKVSRPDEIKFIKTTGMTPGEYLVKTGNIGTPDKVITNEAIKFASSKAAVDSEFAKMPGVYKSAPLKIATDELLARELRISRPGVPSNDLQYVQELADKLNREGLSMKEVNEIKRLYERNVKLGYQQANEVEKVSTATLIDSKLKEWQFDIANKQGFKNIAEMNKQTQASYAIVNNLGKASVDELRNSTLSLTDYIMLSGGDASAVAGFLTKKFFSSKTFKAELAKLLSGYPELKMITPEVSNTVERMARDLYPETGALPQLPAPSSGALRSENFVSPELPTRGLPDEPGFQVKSSKPTTLPKLEKLPESYNPIIAKSKVKVNSVIPKNIEKSVLQIVDEKTGKVTYKVIKKGQLKDFDNLVDNTDHGIAGMNIKGKIYHLTAKSPTSMDNAGAKYIGIAKLSDVPKLK